MRRMRKSLVVIATITSALYLGSVESVHAAEVTELAVVDESGYYVSGVNKGQADSDLAPQPVTSKWEGTARRGVSLDWAQLFSVIDSSVVRLSLASTGLVLILLSISFLGTKKGRRNVGFG